MMRSAIAVLVVVLLGAGPVLANPVAFDAMSITFDPGNYMSRLDPAPYSQIQAYVMLEMFASYTGFTTVSFKINVTPGTSAPPSFQSLLPGGLSIGLWEEGITLSSTECITPDMHPYPIAAMQMFYLGVPGDIIIGDHPDYPRWVVDCDDNVHIYCVLMNGGIGKDAVFGDCEGQPVEASSWSAIKSLYR
jgi:hypothetical protein